MAETRSAGSEKLRLREIAYVGLLGRRSGSIRLDDNRPTVLTGANGTGKSTILRVISAMAKANATVLANAPVNEFRLIFESHDDLTFSRSASTGHGVLSWGRGRKLPIRADRVVKNIPGWAQDILEENQGNTSRTIDEIANIGRHMGRAPSEIRRIQNALLHGEINAPDDESVDWINRLRRDFEVLYVSDQRIMSARERGRADRSYGTSGGIRTSTRLAVEAASMNIAEKIGDAAEEYGVFSTMLDRSMPNQLIAALGAKEVAININGPVRLLEETERRRAALAEIGLLDVQNHPIDVPPKALEDENIRRAVQAVLELNMHKFSILEDLEERLSAFKRFLDDRLHPKRVVVDRKSGLSFSLPGGESVQPRQLSSGEQQITVLAYEILFNTSPGNLVLIDEPELSLHVLWQDSLLDDLMKMGSAANAQFLLATHAPAILAGAPDLERSLDVDQDDANWH